MRYRNRRRLKASLWLCGLSMVAWLAARQCGVDLPELVRGLPTSLVRLRLFFQPSVSHLPEMFGQAAVTVMLALLATPLAVAIALAVAVGAASNLSPSPCKTLFVTILSLANAVSD